MSPGGRIRTVQIWNGNMNLLAGQSTTGNADGLGTAASFSQLLGEIVYDPVSGYLYVADSADPPTNPQYCNAPPRPQATAGDDASLDRICFVGLLRQ